MARRKAIKVRELLTEVNRLNRESHGRVNSEMRHGWNNLLEHVLHTTGNYAGYCYLTRAEVPTGELPGIIPAADPTENVFPDESRRSYYVKQQ